jgi:hypothetical protein
MMVSADTRNNAPTAPAPMATDWDSIRANQRDRLQKLNQQALAGGGKDRISKYLCSPLRSTRNNFTSAGR